MPDLINLIPFAILVVIIGFLAYQVVILYNDKLDLIKELVQAYNDIDALSDRLGEVAEKAALLSGSENDFLKFLSDSRDDAFGYIDNVQAAITEFRNATDSKDKKQISETYNKLISFLPSDNGVVE